jgi:hypothetical protein
MATDIIEELERELEDVQQINNFVHAGNATFTLRAITGTRFTYKVQKPLDWNETKPRWFVKVLVGPKMYAYLGMLVRKEGQYSFTFTKASKLGNDAPSAKAFVWFYRLLVEQKVISEKIEFWHSGRCGCCGKKLTVPKSIAMGFGPECAGKF